MIFRKSLNFKQYPGNEGDFCTSNRCFFSRIKQRAEFWHKYDKRWVCLTCAQQENRDALNRSWSMGPSCISGRDWLIETLSN